MNYADFGVSGPEDLEQDEWSLTEPVLETPKGSILSVKGHNGKKGKYKKYLALCSACSKDQSLFGAGVFSVLKHDFTKGTIPCGCSLTPRWTEPQYRTRVGREAERRGYTFLGWKGDFKAGNTRCRLVCPVHGEWSSAIIKAFFSGRGCPVCAETPQKSGALKDDSLHIKAFMETGSFLPGTVFWRSQERGRNQWSFTCPVCSKDEYVQAGLCDGVFSSWVGKLKSGRCPCRCSSHRPWTKEQREYQIKKEMEERRKMGASDLSFVRWASDKADGNTRERFIYNCPDHGEQETSTGSFLYAANGCPQCVGKNQQMCYLNIVKDGCVPVAIKLGISNNPEKRIQRQNHRNLFHMTQAGVWSFPSVKSCKESEKTCKQELTCGVLSEREMKDGWTETVSVLDLEKVIAIYEKHGGVRIK